MEREQCPCCGNYYCLSHQRTSLPEWMDDEYQMLLEQDPELADQFEDNHTEEYLYVWKHITRKLLIRLKKSKLYQVREVVELRKNIQAKNFTCNQN